MGTIHYNYWHGNQDEVIEFFDKQSEEVFREILKESEGCEVDFIMNLMEEKFGYAFKEEFNCAPFHMFDELDGFEIENYLEKRFGVSFKAKYSVVLFGGN